MGAAQAKNRVILPLRSSAMVYKLNRTCQRTSLKRPKTATTVKANQTTKQTSAKSTSTNEEPQQQEVEQLHDEQLQEEEEKNQPQQIKQREHNEILRPLPRCSSFVDTKYVDMPMIPDPRYAVWKSSFERPHSSPDREGDLDISEALSGQLTPRGFPSYIDVEKSSASVRRSVSLRLPVLKFPMKPKKKVCQEEDKAELILKPTTAPPPPTKQEMSRTEGNRPEQQYLVMEKIFANMKDLKEYYDGRLPYWNLRI